MIIYIDIDDTVAKYTEAVRARVDSEFPQSKEGFFRTLEPKEDAVKAVQMLIDDGNFVYFATRPSYKNPHCFTEKALWVQDVFGLYMYYQTIIIPDKSLLRGDVLIDDHSGNGQDKFKGNWIQFGNEEWPDWKTIMDKFFNMKIQ